MGDMVSAALTNQNPLFPSASMPYHFIDVPQRNWNILYICRILSTDSQLITQPIMSVKIVP
jgi:hypothetical protein